MKIRSKLVGIVSVAILFPLLLSFFYIEHIGSFYYRRQKGILYRTIAAEMAGTLADSIQHEHNQLRNWIEISPLKKWVQEVAQPPFDSNTVTHIERNWSRLTEQDEPLRSITSSPLADYLRMFTGINPVFAEILVTDPHGRLLGATSRTTDYWQADETWWQETRPLPRKIGLIHPVDWDDSAQLLAIDITFPLYTDSGAFIGILKSSVNVTHLLSMQAPEPWNQMIIRDIVFPDGRLLLRINPQDEPTPATVNMEALKKLTTPKQNWDPAELYPDSLSLAAACSIDIGKNTPRPYEHFLYVLVHRNLHESMAPIEQMVRKLTVRSGILMLIFAILSYLLATAWFAHPLEKLRKTAQYMSAHIRMQEAGEIDQARESMEQAENQLQLLQSIKTHDELQELAADFSSMGTRVLTFHRQLERELTEKTEELNSDLVLAREFQEALITQDYPVIPFPAGVDNYRLSFNHIYYPALSISGDFFDISKLSDHCVRIFIADVMGHGARAALMTAILYTLLYSTPKNEDPARLLEKMNREFYSLGLRTQETVFVTAAHLVIDTRTCQIQYASAGHPAPLVVDLATGFTHELTQDEGEHFPAAGLIEDTVYRSATYPITKEQTLLLYTDGAIEAQNADNHEFGHDRLLETITDAYRAGKMAHLPQYLIETLESFMDTASALDDICLVSVGITKP